MACPTADDLGDGIRVDYAEGHSIITKDAEGVVREVEHSGDEVYVYVTDNGLLETGFEDPAADETGRFEYTFSLDDLVPPTPWGGANGEQISLDADGAEIERLKFYYRTRGPGQIDIGDCVYDMIPVQTYYGEGDERSMVELVYLTDLQIPLAIGYGGPGYFDPFVPTSISVVVE